LSLSLQRKRGSQWRSGAVWKNRPYFSCILSERQWVVLKGKTAMNCPVCKEPLVVLEYDSVEVDYCFACDGVWLDAGELRLLFGDARQCDAFLNGGTPHERSPEKPRRCPICRKKMAKAVTRGDHPVTYDLCARGDGLWFDKGELARVLAHGVAHHGGDKVAEHLREIFGGGLPAEPV